MFYGKPKGLGIAWLDQAGYNETEPTLQETFNVYQRMLQELEREFKELLFFEGDCSRKALAVKIKLDVLRAFVIREVERNLLYRENLDG